MKIPDNMTEAEVVAVLERVMKNLAAKFRFGYHETEDMRQLGFQFAIEALNKGAYDVSRPLENFLFTHIRNRLINYKRDKYVRNDSPCKGCVFFDPQNKKSKNFNQCAVYENKDECKKLSAWIARNVAKKNLMMAVQSNPNATNHEAVNQDGSDSIKELESIIDNHLSVNLRSDYLRMKEGQRLPRAREEKVRGEVKNIMDIYYHAEE